MTHLPLIELRMHGEMNEALAKEWREPIARVLDHETRTEPWPMTYFISPKDDRYGGRTFLQERPCIIGVFVDRDSEVTRASFLHEHTHWLRLQGIGGKPGDAMGRHDETFFALLRAVYQIGKVKYDLAKSIEDAPSAKIMLRRW